MLKIVLSGKSVRQVRNWENLKFTIEFFRNSNKWSKFVNFSQREDPPVKCLSDAQNKYKWTDRAVRVNGQINEVSLGKYYDVWPFGNHNFVFSLAEKLGKFAS